jgi:hypothetical protein
VLRRPALPRRFGLSLMPVFQSANSAEVRHSIDLSGWPPPLPPFAYRLARVAAGDGVAADSLNGPCGWDYAAGHALIRGAGGVLVDEYGHEVTYKSDGSSYTGFCFGGGARAVREPVARDWDEVRSSPHLPRRTRIGWPRQASDVVIDRAVGCLLGQIVGDSPGSLVSS